MSFQPLAPLAHAAPPLPHLPNHWVHSAAHIPPALVKGGTADLPTHVGNELMLSPAVPCLCCVGALQLRVGYPPLSGNARQSGRQALAFYAKPDVTHLMAFNAFHAGNWRCCGEGGGGRRGEREEGRKGGGAGAGEGRGADRGKGQEEDSGYTLHDVKVEGLVSGCSAARGFCFGNHTPHPVTRLCLLDKSAPFLIPLPLY